MNASKYFFLTRMLLFRIQKKNTAKAHKTNKLVCESLSSFLSPNKAGNWYQKHFENVCVCIFILWFTIASFQQPHTFCVVDLTRRYLSCLLDIDFYYKKTTKYQGDHKGNRLNKTFPLNNLKSTFLCSKANNLCKYLRSSLISRREKKAE